MTVERKFPIFDIVKTFVRRVITSDHVRDAFRGIAYLFEAIGNEAPPSSGAQVVAGHDHADQGGAYIARGGVGSQFSGRSPLFADTPIQQWALMEVSSLPARDVDGNPPTDQLGCTLVFYASPGIDTQLEGVHWELRMRVYWAKAAGYNCKLRFENPEVNPLQPWLKVPNLGSVEIEVEPSDDIQELTLRFPVTGDFWNRINIYHRAQGGEAPFTQDLEIWDYQVHETQDVSQPKSSGVTRFV